MTASLALGSTRPSSARASSDDMLAYVLALRLPPASLIRAIWPLDAFPDQKATCLASASPASGLRALRAFGLGVVWTGVVAAIALAATGAETGPSRTSAVRPSGRTMVEATFSVIVVMLVVLSGRGWGATRMVDGSTEPM